MMARAHEAKDTTPLLTNSRASDVLIAPAAASGQRTSIKRQLVAAFCAILGPFSLGFVLGYSSPALPELQADGRLNEEQGSWFGSLVTLGAILGGPVGGLAVESLGRRGAIITSALPYLAGWVFIIASNKVWMLYVGRVLTGFASGLSSICVPIYIAEIADQSVRGQLGAGFQVGSTSGILAVYAAGLGIGWTWLAVLSATFPALMGALMLAMSETPRWLLSRGERPKALRTLAWLREKGSIYEVEQECRELELNLHDKTGGMSLFDFGRPFLYKPLIIGLMLMFFQQMSGINAVIFYTSSIFSKAGFSGNSGLPTVLVGAVQVVVTIFSTFLVDRAGRRVLLIVSGVLMTISCVVFGLYYYLTSHLQPAPDLSWMSLASLAVYILGFSLGWGALPWLIMAELFPVRARGVASGICTAANWLMAFLVTKEFDAMQTAITPYGVFWLFGGVAASGVVFVALFLPETKGRSLEDIEEYFTGHSGHSR